MLHYTALVTVLAVLLYFATGIRVARARQEFGVPPPAIAGNAAFERIFRVQANTLEWMPIFLPLLWLFGYYISDGWAAAIGVVWVVGRILYMVGYARAAEQRRIGFLVQSVSCAVLLIGALAGIVRAIV